MPHLYISNGKIGRIKPKSNILLHRILLIVLSQFCSPNPLQSQIKNWDSTHLSLCKTIPSNSFCNTSSPFPGLWICLPGNSATQIAKLCRPFPSASCQTAATLYQGFNPSSVNLLRIAIAADSILQNGYFLEMGGKEDNVKILLRIAQKDSVLFQSKTLFNKSSNTLMYSAILQPNLIEIYWKLPDSLYTKIQLPNHFYNPFSTSILTHWGVENLQTGTTSAGKTKIYNIYFGDVWKDTMPPKITAINSVSNQQIQIHFNKPLSIQPYSVNQPFMAKINQLPKPIIQFQSQSLIIDSCQLFCNQSVQLQLLHLRDTANNPLDSLPILFQHTCANRIPENTIAITEIMYKPLPNQGYLPPTQYIEINNLTQNGMWLDSLKLSDPHTTGLPTRKQWLKPNGFLLLIPAKDTQYWKSFNPNLLLPISPWPAFNTTSDTIYLRNNKNEMIRQVYYSNTFSPSPYKNGGYSIEKSNEKLFCIDNINWQTNKSIGGTPLKSHQTTPVICPPYNTILSATINQNTCTLESLYPLYDSQWNRIQFQINLHHAQSSYLPWKFQPSKKFSSMATFNTSFPPSMLQELQLSGTNTEDILANSPTELSININFLEDCASRIAPSQTLHFNYFNHIQKATANSLKISEIMFNNSADYPDFIEITNTTNYSISTSELEIQYYNGEDSNVNFLIQLQSIDSIFPPQTTWVISNNQSHLYHQFQSPYYFTFKQSESMGNLLAEKGIIKIIHLNSQQIIDQVAYHQDWHHALLTETKGVSLHRIQINNNGLLPTSWISSSYAPQISVKNDSFCFYRMIPTTATPGYHLNTTYVAPIRNWISLNHPFYSYSSPKISPVCELNPNIPIAQLQISIYALSGKFAGYLFPLQNIDVKNPLYLNHLQQMNLPIGNYILQAQAIDAHFQYYHQKFLLSILP